MSQSPSRSNALDEYQALAANTAKYSNDVHVLLNGSPVALYPFLKLAGEAGEVADKVGKIIRDDDAMISATKRTALMFELGDVLWYVAECSRILGYNLSHVAASNINKLHDRAKRDALGGSGDNR